jgi:hypothetical protein
VATTNLGRRRARIVIDDAETEVAIGTNNRKVKVRKAKYNTMCIREVRNEGVVKMNEMNMPEVRCRRRCRIKREICTLQLELNNYLSDKDGSSKMKELMQKLEGSSTIRRSNVRCEHRMMMKNLWAVPELNDD